MSTAQRDCDLSCQLLEVLNRDQWGAHSLARLASPIFVIRRQKHLHREVLDIG